MSLSARTSGVQLQPLIFIYAFKEENTLPSLFQQPTDLSVVNELVTELG